ncbi:hypothetical protein CATMQ487_05020 [Sphaerotilus microaerophilus]|uniref:Uncharacterized protein n=1 Tax=Sphaerotilus microaerophilus TaxID=2914710 RepID=A0ABM7YH67_9BURK|nr:hypothetical protein CATMQ487_05020 [Sphaerotilus sp. FB-5]
MPSAARYSALTVGGGVTPGSKDVDENGDAVVLMGAQPRACGRTPPAAAHPGYFAGPSF